ncbi:MAG TPA: hypothetical protein VIH95_06615 [Acidimicrobiales bacterium]
MVKEPKSALAEAIRELRTSVRVILDEASSPMILVTSPEPGDGRTFLSANLAAALATSGGIRSRALLPPPGLPRSAHPRDT